MLSFLVRTSLAHRVVVLALAAVLLVWGGLTSRTMPIDVFPDVSAPRVTIVTEATGLASDEIEALISRPIERAMTGTPGVFRTRSASAGGISVVWVEFDWSATPTAARQRVAERLQNVGDLPASASLPTLAPPSSVMGEIMFVALTSDTVGSMELRRHAELVVRRRLLAEPGVAHVVAIGGDEQQFVVRLDPARLAAAQIMPATVIAALHGSVDNPPGGFLVSEGNEATVRIVRQATSPEAIAALTVQNDAGALFAVRDFAQVTAEPGPRRGTASYNGQAAIMLTVVKQTDADTIATTERVDAVLTELEPALASVGVMVHRDVFRQKDFIDTSLRNVTNVLRDGAGLVVLVLLVFLWSLRSTVISAIAIPLSLVAATLILYALGYRFDTMTLGGFAIAIGELVDDAIVDVENVLRRLRDRARMPEAERPSVTATVLSASMEVRASIVNATIIIMLVFMPLLFLTGLEGQLLRPLAIAYLVAIFASLVVAVTITPVLCAQLLPKVAASQHRTSPVTAWLERVHARALAACLARPRVIIIATLALLACAALAITPLRRAFLPEFNEGNFTIGMALPPGTPLADSDALARMAERALLTDRAVMAVGRRTGRAERDEHVQGVEASELEVRIRPGDRRTRRELEADLRTRLASVPGAAFTLGQPISHRIEHMISGQRTAFAIKVFGPDLAALRQIAEQIRVIASDSPGLTDVAVEQVVDVPQVRVVPDITFSRTHAAATSDIASQASLALWGTEVAQVPVDELLTPIVVRLGDDVHTAAQLSALQIVTGAGGLVPLGQVAQVQQDLGPNYILRENGERRVVITANLTDGDAVGAYLALRQRVEASLKPQANVRVAYAGQFERAGSTNRTLWSFGGLAFLAIVWVTARTLGSMRRTAIVLLNIPLALAGGVVGVYWAGGTLSVATTIGFITLFGIAMRNGILLATRIADLEQGEQLALPDAVTRASRERLAPILMTALTAALGLLPLALAAGRAGSEIQAPMAMVILTGLVTATVLNMLVIPTLLVRFGAHAR